jgi:hypothetical protein
MKYLGKFILYVIAAITLVRLWRPLNSISPIVEFSRRFFEFNLKEMIIFTVLVISLTFIALTVILFIVTAIINLFLFYSDLFFNTKDRVSLFIDQNNLIRECYVEFKDGKRIPIYINRVMAEVPPMPKEEEASPVKVESELEAKPDDVDTILSNDEVAEQLDPQMLLSDEEILELAKEYVNKDESLDTAITAVEKSISDEEREAIVNHFNKIVESKSSEPTATINAAINGEIIDE